MTDIFLIEHSLFAQRKKEPKGSFFLWRRGSQKEREQTKKLPVFERKWYAVKVHHDIERGLSLIHISSKKGVRYMEMAEGYILSLALDSNNEVIGYKFVRVGKMLEDIRHGVDPKTAYDKNVGTYGRYEGAAKYIDPREE